MKKLLILTAMVGMFAACADDNTMSIGKEGSDVLPDGETASAQFFATTGGVSKTMIDGVTLLWSAGDQVALFAQNDNLQRYQIEDNAHGTQSGVLNLVEGDASGNGVAKNWAYYPHKEEISCSDAGLVVANLNTEPQVYRAGTVGDKAFPMLAVSEDNQLQFTNLFGVLVVKLTGTMSVSSITLTGNNGETLGAATATISEDGTIAWGNDPLTSTTLTCTDPVALSDTPTEFWIALPPVTFTKGFKLTINGLDANNQNEVRTRKTDKTVEIVRNSKNTMKAFDPYVWVLADFENGSIPLRFVSSSQFTVVDNFDKTGINASDKCAKLFVPGTTSTSGYIEIDFNKAGTDFTDDISEYGHFRMKVHYGGNVSYFPRLERFDPDGKSMGTMSPLTLLEKNGEWETLTFEFMGRAYAFFQPRMMKTEDNNNISGYDETTNNRTIYIDDVELYK